MSLLDHATDEDVEEFLHVLFDGQLGLSIEISQHNSIVSHPNEAVVDSSEWDVTERGKFAEVGDFLDGWKVHVGHKLLNLWRGNGAASGTV